MRLYKVIIFVTLGFWPVSLFIKNTPSNYLSYIAPAILIYLSFLLYKKQVYIYQLPLLLIPVFSPKLVLLPILFLLLDVTNTKKKYGVVLIMLSLIILLVSWKPFIGQTIFNPDYEAQQEVVRNTHLYQSVFMARLFHNKVRIIGDKFLYNFFALTDPNNYFFEFAPRQILGNQNISKFPFLAVLFAVVSFYYIDKFKHKRFFFFLLISSLLNLSVLKVFDGNDFILWIPFGIFISYGIILTSKYKGVVYLYFTYLVFSFVQSIQIFISK